MKKQILDLIKEKPKHYSKMIKNNTALFEWVNDHSLVKTDNFGEMIYSSISQVSNICPNNNKRKFRSMKDGYKGCGPASRCQCISESVAKSVKLSKSKYSQQQIKEINDKRVNTTKKKYGVTNNGQIPKAIQTRTDLYKDKEQVKKITKRNKTTKKERYGDANYNNRDKAEITYLEKTGYKNPSQNPIVSKKAQETKKERYEPYYLAKLNYTSFVKNIIENFELTPLISKEEYIGVGSRPKITFECLHCNHTFIKRFDYASPPKCKICYPTEFTYQSKGEVEVFEYCKTLTDNVEHSNRTLINPYEIDIYLPNFKLAIEYNGLYWHSEIGGKKSYNYHYRKFNLLQEKGIQLLTIYSDEWENKKAILKEMIKQKLGLGDKKNYARKLDIRQVDRIKSIEFVNEYHLQGAPKQMPKNYGLYKGDELLSVMSFRKVKGNLELIRFCSNSNVVGGASRLLKYCINQNPNMNIVSFSDNRYSTGNLYKVLGFDQVGIVPRMQEYVKDYSSRIHKLGAGKILKEVNRDDKTEWQLMQEQGYDRIWDCGKIKWMLTV